MNTTTIPTPAGPLSVVATETGAVFAAGFTDDPGQLVPAGTPLRPLPELGDVSKAVLAYLDGDLAAVERVPVDQPGGGFIEAAWAALRRTRPGDRLTYTALAGLAGRPTAVRAAASACARNAVALFVPCHRVLRSDGGLGGYRWGIPVKRWLLDHERRHR